MTFWVMKCAQLAENGESVLSGTAQNDRKYHIADGVPREGGGGEYPLQMGLAGLTVWYAV